MFGNDIAKLEPARRAGSSLVFRADGASRRDFLGQVPARTTGWFLQPPIHERWVVLTS